jgi:hypothetical protein
VTSPFSGEILQGGYGVTGPCFSYLGESFTGSEISSGNTAEIRLAVETIEAFGKGEHFTRRHGMSERSARALVVRLSWAKRLEPRRGRIDTRIDKDNRIGRGNLFSQLGRQLDHVAARYPFCGAEHVQDVTGNAVITPQRVANGDAQNHSVALQTVDQLST